MVTERGNRGRISHVFPLESQSVAWVTVMGRESVPKIPVILSTQDRDLLNLGSTFLLFQ